MRKGCVAAQGDPDCTSATLQPPQAAPQTAGRGRAGEGQGTGSAGQGRRDSTAFLSTDSATMVMPLGLFRARSGLCPPCLPFLSPLPRPHCPWPAGIFVEFAAWDAVFEDHHALI
jgi:hypothetical protein